MKPTYKNLGKNTTEKTEEERKETYRPTLLMYTTADILNKIPVRKTQKYIKNIIQHIQMDLILRMKG